MKQDFQHISSEAGPGGDISYHSYCSEIAAATQDTLAELEITTPVRRPRSAQIACLDDAGRLLGQHDLLLRAGRIDRSILHLPPRTRKLRLVLGMGPGPAPDQLATRLTFPGRLSGLLRLAVFVWRVNRLRGVGVSRLVLEKTRQLHRLGLRNLLSAPATHVDFREIGSLDYQTWLKRSLEQRTASGSLAADGPACSLAVFVDARSGADGLPETMQALAGLEHVRLTVRVFGDFTAAAAGELASTGPPSLSCAPPEHFAQAVRSALPGTDWAWFIRAGDVIRPHAPYVLSRLKAGGEHGPLCYFDHDSLSQGQRHSPAFKPDWNREFYLHSDYIGRALVVDSDYLDGQTLPATPGRIHERLLFAALNAGIHPRHGPDVLMSIPTETESGVTGKEVQRKRRVSEFLTAAGVAHRWRDGAPGVSSDFLDYSPGFEGSLPRVAVIIPTRDQRRLISQCVNSIREVTDYPNFEIVIVDNGSRDRKALQYLDECGRREACRVLRFDQPFNFSAINNFAVEHVDAELICLVNNDIKAFRAEWLANMAAYFAIPDIGAVGAKLLYRDRRVQHAGIVCGLGNVAGHAHRFHDAAADGYLHRLQFPNEFSAVTGACLMTRGALYRELGGLNARELAVAYNDVDYCLRLRRAGYRIVYAPQAELFHLESKSRGSDDTAEKKERYEGETRYMWRSWREELLRDPHYNPNLTRVREDFSVNPAAAGLVRGEDGLNVSSGVGANNG